MLKKEQTDVGYKAHDDYRSGECGCIRCGKKGSLRFRALEVRTLHVRDMDREKRVQALGNFKDFAVCTECAEQKLVEILSIKKAIVRRLLPFGLVLAIGIILTAAFLSKDRVIMMLGVAAMVCGVLGIWSFATEGTRKIWEYKAKSKDEALSGAAWEAVIESAPMKEGDTDLTYIPINEETLSRKNGDLMILYDLLPDIAVQAHKMIHE